MIKCVQVESINDLKFKSQYKYQGNSSTLYELPANLLFKLFLPQFRYKGLTKNQEFIYLLKNMDAIKDAPNLVKPDTIYENKESFFGYTILKIPAKPLYKIDNNASIDQLFWAVNDCRKTIKSISKEHLNLVDLHVNNLLYNGKISLIDIENSRYCREVSTEFLYQTNMKRIYSCVINCLTYFLKYDILTDPLYKSILKGLESIDSDDYAYLLTYLKELLENRFDTEIVTVKDMKKTLNKCSV